MSRDVHASAKSRPAGLPGSNARSVLETGKRRPAGAYLPYVGATPVVPVEAPPAPKRARKVK